MVDVKWARDGGSIPSHILQFLEDGAVGMIEANVESYSFQMKSSDVNEGDSRFVGSMTGSERVRVDIKIVRVKGNKAW